MIELLPLLLIAVLLPKAICSTREGIVYGALGGLDFAMLEFGANFAVSGYAEHGLEYLRTAVPGRWALGADSHIRWGATTGAGVGYLLSHQSRG